MDLGYGNKRCLVTASTGGLGFAIVLLVRRRLVRRAAPLRLRSRSDGLRPQRARPRDGLRADRRDAGRRRRPRSADGAVTGLTGRRRAGSGFRTPR